MIYVPQYLSIVSGNSEGGSELTAFDNALLKAGIGNLNLIKVSSVAPKKAQILPMPHFEPASLVPAVLSVAISEESGVTIAAAVGIGLSEDSFGMLMEYNNHCTAQEAEEEVKRRLKESFEVRGMQLKRITVASAQHTVESCGCAMAAVVLWGDQAEKRDEDWAGENWSGNVRFSFKVRERLFSQTSEFQKIEILDTKHFGRMLMLDDTVQTTEKDGFVYHEMLVHPPMLTHPSPRHILIVGGGDCGALKAALEHPVERVRLVEIDRLVYEASTYHIPSISGDAFQDSRAEIVLEDAFTHLSDIENMFDVILVDSTDPVGPAERLFASDFYHMLHKVLRSDGLLVTQSGSPWFQPDVVTRASLGLRGVFSIVRTYTAYIPTYPGGFWTFTLASKKYDPISLESSEVAKRFHDLNLTTSYYTPELHKASFALPAFVTKLVERRG